MPANREPDPTRRNERAHTAILRATKQLIAKVGYDRMSIEAIAATAGVGKQTIYRWWPSKAAVVLDMWAPAVAKKLVFPDTGDLSADLKAQISAVIDLGKDPVFGPCFRALVAESQHDRALATQLLERIFHPRIAAAKTRFLAAQDAGQLAHDLDLDIVVDLIYGGFYHRYLLGVAPLDPQYPDAIVNAALTGLAPRPT